MFAFILQDKTHKSDLWVLVTTNDRKSLILQPMLHIWRMWIAVKIFYITQSADAFYLMVKDRPDSRRLYSITSNGKKIYKNSQGLLGS